MRTWIFLPAIAVLLGGCASQPYVNDVRLERGLVIVLPGIEGRGPLNEAICRGLNDAGVNWAIQLHDWTSWLGPLYNLRAEVRNRQKALRIAERIVQYRWDHPARPVVLVGHSGGGAMAAWVAEALPRGVRVDGIIMIAPALSPQYLLDWALANSRMGIINFYSARDWILLGVGTTVYGTMDGEHTSSAGRVGFERSRHVRPGSNYEKLFQVAWTEQMSGTGHSGGHFSSSAGQFVGTYVSPFVLASHWTARHIGRVVGAEPDEVGGPVVGAAEAKPAPPGARRPEATVAKDKPREAGKSRPRTTMPVVQDMEDGKPLPWIEFDPDR